MSTTGRQLSTVKAKPGCTRRARSTSNRTAAYWPSCCSSTAVVPASWRDGQRRQAPDHFAQYAECFPAGSQEVSVRALAQDRRDERRTAGNHVLAIVEDDQCAPRLQSGHECRQHREVAIAAQADHRGGLPCNKLWIRFDAGLHAGELNQPEPVGIGGSHLMTKLDRQACLSTTARPYHGQQSSLSSTWGRRLGLEQG